MLQSEFTGYILRFLQGPQWELFPYIGNVGRPFQQEEVPKLVQAKEVVNTPGLPTARPVRLPP